VAGRGAEELRRGTSGWSPVTDAVNRRDFQRGISSADDTAKGLYDREYARDLVNRWPWWLYGGGGSYSDGAYGTSNSGYGYDASGYGSGYSSGYSNPYSTGSAATVSDSGVNAASADANSSTTPTTGNETPTSSRDDASATVTQRMDMAMRAFKGGHYAAAQKECEQAIELQKTNDNLHEFRALCQFAQGNYKDAAATLHTLLAAGPGWNWSTVSAFYASAQSYTTQLRTLERFIRENATDAAARFVAAYHYFVIDARDAALHQLREVATLQPQDKLSAGIVQALEKAKTNNGAVADKPVPGR